MSHNFYLKLFQTQIDKYKDLIDYDYVLLDEAQDTNDVTLAIFNALNGRKYLLETLIKKFMGLEKQ